MNYTELRHEQACLIQHRVINDPASTEEYPATYWLSLACALLTSPVKAEREQGKTLVRTWKYNKPA